MPAPKLGTPLAECRSCHEPIRFVRLDTGKAMPVNPLFATCEERKKKADKPAPVVEEPLW